MKKGFVMMPKMLFDNERFGGLSAEAKMLYSIMLDRKSLSQKNNWKDEQEDTQRDIQKNEHSKDFFDAVFIFYTLEEIMKTMGCGESKAVRLRKQLCAHGLIRLKRQGLNKPHKIYVKNIVENNVENNKENHKNCSKETSWCIEKEGDGAVENGDIRHSKSTGNNTDINKTDISKTKYAEHVFLGTSEHEELFKELGADGLKWCIDKLNNYKGAKGIQNKSDFYDIRSWVIDLYKKKQAPSLGGSPASRRFQNFEGEALNHAKLEQLEREYLDKRFGRVEEYCSAN